ncbi:MAG: alpha-glucan family phosphorylase [Dehalococcoidales bacterium]|nr:alpha-glucan family phosphorylase [Dehalococcoidales bacterium]
MNMMSDYVSKNQKHKTQPGIAYFSMEVGIDPSLPTYSGGLGVLAGDTLRAAADLGVPMVGMTLLYRKGYFRQHLDSYGNQSESPTEWSPEKILEPMEPRAIVTIEGRNIKVRAWRYTVQGINGHVVPVYFLDTSLPDNSNWDQELTDHLYGRDDHYRLCQEVVLGMGGIAMLRALGYREIQSYHMNEGHSALLTLALIEEYTQKSGVPAPTEAQKEAVRQHCVFTTHTPVPAGHDKFSLSLARQVLGEERANTLTSADCCYDGMLNMTYLALSLSRYINGVAMRHGQISRDMFPSYPINSITNGVHAVTWTTTPFQRLFDSYIPEWRKDHIYLRYTISIPLDEIRQAHAEAKRELLAEVERRSGIRLDPTVLTLGFARRASTYKRADLLLSDIERLKRIARQVGPLQIIYGGKAHPRDKGGKAVIRRIFEAIAAVRGLVPIVYLEDYDMTLGHSLCAGVDLWVNTPQKPQEASGTSGMKAALNGVPSLSVLDGWWVEGHLEGVTGWSIGDSWQVANNPAVEAASLYEKLEELILPLFYKRPDAFAEIMRSAIAINGSFFNAQRMVSQYVKNAYRLELALSQYKEVDMVTEAQIRELAYALWEQEGRLEGKDQEYYFRAKQMLKEQEAASLPVKEPVPPASALQPPSAPKPIARRTGKGRSKKA